MPQPRTPRPEVMTWPKASLYIGVAATFDVLKFLCEVFFWILGPALIAYYVSHYILWGGTVSNIAGVAAGGTAAFFGEPAIIFFGMLLGIFFGFMGWLLTGLLLVFRNRRIFSENATNFIWFIGGLAMGSIPFMGALPALTGTVVAMFRTQIHKEKAALQQWEAEQARLDKEDAAEQVALRARAEVMLHNANVARMQAEAANDTQTSEEVAGKPRLVA